jgi:succinyl-CoA synthetase beta subunit
MLVDRATGRIAFVVSTEGGMDIEQVAHDTPEKILTFAVDPATGVMPHHGRTVAKALGLKGSLAKEAEEIVTKLYTAFLAKDMEMLEINPLIVTKDGHLRCLDAKVSFDGNALYRHPDMVQLRDITEEDEKEIEASKHDLAYIALDGTIGCMVNGAGLAMATLDIIKLYGEEPANFLDVGGGASEEKVTAAFKIITADPQVKGILVNIFGGIMKCDVIARGVLAAVKTVGLQVPLVVRLEGHQRRGGQEDHPRVRPQRDPGRRPRRRGAEDRERGSRRESKRHPCPFSSTRTRRSSARASPARTAPSIPSRPSLTGPRWWAARAPAKAARAT